MKIYFVKQGDTLSEIGKRFDVTVEELMKANPIISNPDELRIGMKLIIPIKKQAKPEVFLNKDKDKGKGNQLPEPCVDPPVPLVIPPIAQNLHPLQPLIQHPVPMPLQQHHPLQDLHQNPQQYPLPNLPPYPQQIPQLYTQQYPQQNTQQTLPLQQQNQQQYPQQYQQLYPQQPAYPPFASYPIPAVQANVQAGLPSQGKPMYPWNSYPSYEQQGIDAPYNTPFNINPYKQTLPKPPTSASAPPATTGADVQADHTQTEWNPYRPKKEQSQEPLQEVKLHAIPITEAEYTSKQTLNKKNKKPRNHSLSAKLQQLQKKRAGTKRVSRRTGKSYPWMPD